MSHGSAEPRVDWVDYAKGWCIILVVMMHATLSVSDALGGAESFLNDFVAWARPFRMPDFFLVAGLFLSRTIDMPARHFLDRKVVHFVYFYLLWTLIQGVPKLMIAEGGDPIGVLGGLALALVEPFGTMWFIYLLPIFFVVIRLTRRVPVEAMLAVGVVLQMLQIATISTVIDEFAARFVFFYAGYAFAPQIFAFAARVRIIPTQAVIALLVWGFVNWYAVHVGVAALPGVSLALGFVGAGAVVAFSALLAQAGALPMLRRIGSKSIVIYLAFFLPMAVTRIALVSALHLTDPALVSLVTTAIAIAAPLALEAITRSNAGRFLFKRPNWLHIAPVTRPQTALHGRRANWARTAS